MSVLPSHFVGHFDAVRRRFRTVSDEKVRVRPQAVVVQIRYVERPRVQNADVARQQTVRQAFELRQNSRFGRVQGGRYEDLAEVYLRQKNLKK